MPNIQRNLGWCLTDRETENRTHDPRVLSWTLDDWEAGSTNDNGTYPQLTSDQENRQQEVREQGGEVDHLPGPAHTLPDAEVADDPHQRECTGQLPADVAYVLDTAGDLQRAAPVAGDQVSGFNDEWVPEKEMRKENEMYLAA